MSIRNEITSVVSPETPPPAFNPARATIVRAIPPVHLHERTTDATRQALQTRMAELMSARGGLGRIQWIEPRLAQEQTGKRPQHVADATTKFLVFDRADACAGWGVCSSPVAPELVSRAVERGAQAAEALGPELGAVVLRPWASGEADGLSFAVFPFRQPFSTDGTFWKLRRWLLGAQVMRWLRRATRQTMRVPSHEGLRADFLAPLESLAADARFDGAVRMSAERAIDDLNAGDWSPRYVLAHNDIWIGNLLRSVPGESRGYRFVMIDWSGSRADGHAGYDLVRAADSLRVLGWRLRREATIHARILGCQPRQMNHYLAASLGALGMNLEHFQPERYVKLATDCHRILAGLQLERA